MNTADAHRRDDYRYFMTIPTRWNDNDQLGHVNNVVYYSYFEAVVVRFIMEELGIDWLRSPVIPYAAESTCRFRRPLSFPESVTAAMRVSRIGTSSVTYELALFGGDDDRPAAHGHWVHVFVTRADERPVPIPAAFRSAYEAIHVDPASDGAPRG